MSENDVIKILVSPIFKFRLKYTPLICTDEALEKQYLLSGKLQKTLTKQLRFAAQKLENFYCSGN